MSEKNLSDPTFPAALTPAYAPPARFGVITGLSRRVIYDLLGSGDLRAVKRGATTLIDVQHGLAFLRSLPPAKIKPPRRP